MSDTDGEAENLPEDTTEGATSTDYETETASEFLEEEEEEEDAGSLYDSDEFISGAKISENGTLNLDILEFDFSYGYDCLKYFNLCVLDDKTVVFSSGNFINFFNVETRKIEFRRSALGGGIGHIRKNPNPEYPYFAVAECGPEPIIILYVWPTLEIICVLKGGATKTYANMDFNPDGDLLVSQSGDPDYLITIWDWQHHTILLRTKSYVNDVLRVKFSPYVAGQLTTCGISHIKFWKMASTFTGLKLKGELGRFGKTEYSDIIGVLPMPDSKVVSGCEWGNILVWDDGLITFEVFRSLRRKCHDAPIVQFYYQEGELWTVSMDGHVKVWWFEKIDQADPPDDDRVILVDPTYDFYTPGIKLMSIEKRNPADPTDTFWYGQDGNGGIWLIDLNTDEEPKPSDQLFTCHGGKVRGLATCPFGPYLASLGETGSFFIFDYNEKARIFQYLFPSPGVSLIWLPLAIDPSGEIILVGSEDGQVRVCCVQIPEYFDSEKDNITFTICQVIKPHDHKLTAMSTNPLGTLLVTAGEDSNIFIFKMDLQCHNKCLTPIGFLPTTDIVTCITWYPRKENEVLLGCIHGQMMQIELPCEEQPYTNVSFKLKLDPKLKCFTTYKSQIKRDIKIAEIDARKAKKVARKRLEMEQIKKDNPGLEIDEETFLVDSDTEEELEPLYIPEIPCRILWLKYTDKSTIWLSMSGYDAGYIYEYRIDQRETIPLNFRLVEGADDMEISAYIYTSNKEYIVFGMEDGSIRVNKINPDDYMDLTDYFTVAMHDNQRGFIPNLCFSYDEKYFFSCGFDGNTFAYKFNPQNYNFPYTRYRRFRDDHLCVSVPDIETTEKLSLEGVKMKAEDDRIQKLANEHKRHIREIIKNLKERYKKLLNKNLKLLPSQIIPRDELEPDLRVSEYVDQLFEEKIEIVKKKLAFDVEKSRVQVTKLQNYFTNPCDRHPNVVHGINNPDCVIMTVRQRKMPPIFYEMCKIIEQKLQEEQFKGKPPERAAAIQKVMVLKIEKTESPLEFFLLSLSPSVIELRLGPRLTRILAKYRKRKDKWKKRTKEWDDFNSKKPIPGKNHPDDEKFLTEAKISVGDYKLKESRNYKVPHDERETTVKHYKKLLNTREKQYKLRHSFIEKVFNIRDYKYELIQKLKDKQLKIDTINKELPDEHRHNGPAIPAYNPDEFPEEKLKVKVVLPEGFAEQEADVSTPIFVKKPSGDALEKQLLARKQYPKFRDGFFVSNTGNDVVLGVAELTFEELLNFPDNVDTPFESCLKANRINRLLFYQKLTIFEMGELIDDFNNWIYEARKVRLPILIGGNFIDIFIVCVNEELQILKSCEEQEDRLSQLVNSKLSLVHEMEDTLDSLKVDKENHETKLENFKVEESKIQEKFRVAMENNKFYDFLKKVFKKKFKPPKFRHDDESSSSSSSSSEESDYEDDTGSVDSKDFGFIKQDLNVCPKGCEAALFNLTVDLRSKRHEIEQNEKEELRVLDLCKKDIEIASKKLVTFKHVYEECQEKLEEFRREKQQKLNMVRCTVVLHLDQIYGFNPESSDISDFLVFSRSKLSELYKRVRTLQNETLDQHGKHDTYLAHLVRMKKDIIYMKRKVGFLKKEIIHLLKIKFGKTVDINELEMAMIQKSFQKNYVNELEEVMLKKLVYELRVKMADVRGLYIHELELWQKRIVSCQFELSKAIKENTKRLALLTVISKEKKELARFVDSQSRKRERVEHIESIHTDFISDLDKLENIIKEQNRTLQDLKDEIMLLKTKGMAPEVRRRKERLAEYERTRADLEVKAEEEARKWIDYDEYVSESEVEEEESEEAKDQSREPIKTDITIPGYYSNEAEDLVKDLVEDLIKDVDRSLLKRSAEAIAHEILSGILKCHSMQEIVEEILYQVSIQVDEDKRSSIELTAEKIFSLQEQQVSEQDILPFVKELLEETVSEAVCHDPHYLIITIVEKLLETFPIDILSRDNTLEVIASKLKCSIKDSMLDNDELNRSISELPETERAEAVDIINSILERVYGEGIDYVSIINQK